MRAALVGCRAPSGAPRGAALRLIRHVHKQGYGKRCVPEAGGSLKTLLSDLSASGAAYAHQAAKRPSTDE